MQGEGFYAAFAALEKLVQQEGEYHDWKIQPYYFLSGLFATGQGNHEQDGTEDVESRKKGRGRAFKEQLSASNEHLSMMASMQFLSIFGNVSSQDVVRVLASNNVFIGGCDTLDIYAFSNNIQEATAFLREKSPLDYNSKIKIGKEIFSILTQRLTQVGNLLGNPKNKLDLSTQGAHTV